MVKNYEYTYLTRQDMSEEAAKNLQDRIAQSITAKLGEVINTPRSYKKRLAYKIKKQEAAYVNAVLFTLDTEKLTAFKKDTDEMTEVLRGLIVSYDPKKLEREARREPRSSEERNGETLVTKEAPAQPVAKISQEKIEEPKTAVKEEKEEEKPAKVEKKEEKEEKAVEETKKVKKEEEKPAKVEKKEEKEEKAVEEKTAKPKRKTKIKTELKDIEQKLDEILK